MLATWLGSLDLSQEGSSYCHQLYAGTVVYFKLSDGSTFPADSLGPSKHWEWYFTCNTAETKCWLEDLEAGANVPALGDN